MRCFLAIALDEKMRSGIAEVSERLQQDFPEMRWVQPLNFHLTLRYLGELADEQISALTDALHFPRGAFSLRITKAGAFPNMHRPSVIWVGADSPPELIACQHVCESAAQQIGIDLETKPFHPHITLARAKKIQRLGNISTQLESVSLEALDEFPVDRVSLFRSTLTGDGPVYDIIEEFPL